MTPRFSFPIPPARSNSVTPPDPAVKLPADLGCMDGHEISFTARAVGEYVQVGVDPISMLMFLSVASVFMKCPINLRILTEDVTVDRTLASRLLSLLPSIIQRRKKAQARSSSSIDETTLISLFGSSSNKSFYSHCEQSIGNTAIAAWHISSDNQPGLSVGPTLTAYSNMQTRALTGFGRMCGGETPICTNAGNSLIRYLEVLPSASNVQVPYASLIRGAMRPSDMLVFNNILLSVAGLRSAFRHFAEGDQTKRIEATLSDYEVTRAFVTQLNTAITDSRLSAPAVKTASELYKAIMQNDQYQCSISGRSDLGHKFFVTGKAAKVIKAGHTTAWNHLKELTKAGIVVTAAPEAIRRQGKEVNYTFAKGVRPPFGISNPFLHLPTVAQISDEFNS